LDKRRQHITELKSIASAAEERAVVLKERINNVECDRRQLEQELNTLREERDNM
jgi:hypothetical protein